MKKNYCTLLVVLLILTVLLSGCQNSQNADTTAQTSETTSTTTTESTAAPETVSREVITLDLMMAGLAGFADKINTVTNSEVFDEIEEQTGVRMTFTGLTEEQRDVVYASGETTDLITVISTDDCNTLIESEMVIPLDDLIDTFAPNVRDLFPERLASSRDELSNGTGEAYFLPSNAGYGTVNVRTDNSLYHIRWDYYDEMGYPEVTSPDDMLNLLAEMQQLHPQTEDGQKIYGISCVVDTMIKRFTETYGYTRIDNGNNQVLINMMTNEIAFMYGEEDSLFWDAMAYYNKANRMGILDPESLTQTEEDYTDKVTIGRVLSPDFSWLGLTAFNALAEEENPGDNVGFETIPVEGVVYNPGLSIAGWGPTFSLAICATCDYPERAMELINYLYGYEGSRLLNSGLEGRDWEYVNETPVLTEFGIDKWINGGDDWEIKVIRTYLSNFVGIKAGTTCPDGGYVNLYYDTDVYSQTMLSVDLAYSEHYNVGYPFEKLLTMIDEGTAYEATDYDSRLCTATGSSSEDISRIDAKIEDIARAYIPLLVLAESDEEFASLKADMIDELETNNYAESVADWTARFNAALEKYGY